MVEITGDIFGQDDADVVCVTTNGVVKANGDLVMGQGTPTAQHLAAQFARRFPWLPTKLGQMHRLRHRFRVGLLAGVRRRACRAFYPGRQTSSPVDAIRSGCVSTSAPRSSSERLLHAEPLSLSSTLRSTIRFSEGRFWRKPCLTTSRRTCATSLEKPPTPFQPTCALTPLRLWKTRSGS